MLAVLPLVALLGQVAKVDIRAAGTLTSEGALKGTLSVAYAGAGIGGAGTVIPNSDMTVHTGTMPGSYVIEVATGYATAAQLDAYWCANDPALRNHFKDLVVLGTGLSDVTDVVTCVGATGEGCASSTPCDGSGGGSDVNDDGLPDPAPEPEPEPDSTGGNDNDGLSAVAIVFIVLGTLFVLGFLTYLLWPWLQTCWEPTNAHAEPIIGSITPTPSGVALPTLYNVA